jgi:hypothetical protein
VVLTLPKRLRAYFLYHRRRLGGLSRLAYRTLGDYFGAALGTRAAAPGALSSGSSSSPGPRSARASARWSCTPSRAIA